MNSSVAAMLIGSIGVAMMFLDVVPEMRIGCVYLILGVLSASTSLVIARYIGKFESNPMALICWPSLLMTLGAAIYIRDQKRKWVKEKSLSHSHKNWMHLGFQLRTVRRSIHR